MLNKIIISAAILLVFQYNQTSEIKPYALCVQQESQEKLESLSDDEFCVDVISEVSFGLNPEEEDPFDPRNDIQLKE